MLPQAPPPDPFFYPSPAHAAGALLGSGEGDQAVPGGRGRERRLVHAPHSLRVREPRAPAARVAIFSPSVCLSAVGFVCLQCRPTVPGRRLGPGPPSARRGPVRESPGRVALSRGPRTHCPAVRLSGGGAQGTRSAADRRGAGYQPVGPRRVHFAPWELHPSRRYDRRLPESCFLCHFLWRPVFAICGFFLLLMPKSFETFPVSQGYDAFVISRRDNFLKKGLEAPTDADCRS